MKQTDVMETGQYLTFKLGDETFALDVIYVREVLDLTPIVKIPGTPEFMRGVINVRGGVVPVIDLRLKFGLAGTDNSLDTRIIVMEITVEGETTVLGTLADSVDEVIDLDPGHIEPPPKIGLRWRSDLVKGIGKKEDRFIILLDINRVFSEDERAAAQTAAQQMDGAESRDFGDEAEPIRL